MTFAFVFRDNQALNEPSTRPMQLPRFPKLELAKKYLDYWSIRMRSRPGIGVFDSIANTRFFVGLTASAVGLGIAGHFFLPDIRSQETEIEIHDTRADTFDVLAKLSKKRALLAAQMQGGSVDLQVAYYDELDEGEDDWGEQEMHKNDEPSCYILDMGVEHCDVEEDFTLRDYGDKGLSPKPAELPSFSLADFYTDSQCLVRPKRMAYFSFLPLPNPHHFFPEEDEICDEDDSGDQPS